MKKPEIEKILLQREPFLMVDEVDVTKAGETGIARKKVTGKEFYFEGHFPGEPVMPGVIVVETMLQAALVVIGNGDYKLKRIEQVKFRNVIKPNDEIEVSIETEDLGEEKYKVTAELTVKNDTVATGVLVLEL